MTKPTTIRLEPEIEELIEKFKEENNIKTTTKAVNRLLSERFGRDDHKTQLPERDFELDNFIKMLSFLTIKQWEAKKGNGRALVREEDLKRIEEFISAFSNLTHNTNIWRERFKDEGYTNLAEIIEESRNFM